MPRLRCFRRSTTQDLVYALFGESIDEATWHVDLAPGTRNSRFEAENANVRSSAPELDPKGFLIRDLTENAWRDMVGNGVEIDKAEMCRLLSVEVPDYDTATELVAPMCYSESTGLTRGKPGALSCPFGKTI
jgi:hypothetical protein